jgi:hypothetical protein
MLAERGLHMAEHTKQEPRTKHPLAPAGGNVGLPLDRLEKGQHFSAREAWDAVIDERLIAWGSDPAKFADEGVEPPTREAIMRASQWARECRADGTLPPTSVVLDPNGGIVFEFNHSNRTDIVHCWEDGTLEYQQFVGTRLVERSAI